MKFLNRRMTSRTDLVFACEISSLSCSSLESLAPTIPTDIVNGKCSSPNNHSMGSGSFSSLGSVSDFIPSPTREGMMTTATLTAPAKEQKQDPPILPLIGAALVATNPVAFSRHFSSFLRVADSQTDKSMPLHSVSSQGSNIGNGNSVTDSRARRSFGLIILVSVLFCGIWMLHTYL